MSAEMPPRIYATVNGMRTELMGGRRYLIGGWEAVQQGRSIGFVRADIADGLLEVARELHHLGLVIESAVRHADPGNRDLVLTLLTANKAAIARAEAGR